MNLTKKSNLTPRTSYLTPYHHPLIVRHRTHVDKEWSLTDCISFIVMQDEDISQAFTSDHHFEQAGFIKLL